MTPRVFAQVLFVMDLIDTPEQLGEVVAAAAVRGLIVQETEWTGDTGWQVTFRGARTLAQETLGDAVRCIASIQGVPVERFLGLEEPAS